MKTLALFAASLALAAPAFADDGAFYTGPTSAGDPAHVVAHFDADGDTWQPVASVSEDARLSTSNQNLAAVAADKLDNGERGDN